MLYLKLVTDFLGGIRATVFFVLLLLAIAGGKFWQHRAGVYKAQREQAVSALAVQRAENERILSALADADNAAKVAIAAKVEAEKAAAKKLKEREKFWKDRYAHDPQAKAWSEQPIPAGVLDGLR